MAGRGHGHSCVGDCDHDDTPELGIHYSLYTKIDLDHVVCLNESEEGSGKFVFKPWEDRLNFEKFVESDVDEELLINIPFTGNVKLKGIIIIGGEDGSHPNKMRLFKNRTGMSFDDARGPADQEFDLQPDQTGTLEYATKVVTFPNISHLSIHFPSNFGAELTKLYYIGLRGEFQEARRQQVTIAMYEARPNPADHKIESIIPMSRQVQ
uniref:PITH domain-containing protein n=1 Tax=Strigamia maritima TaxID=126957 RepID=T1IRT3_STRMM